MTIQELTDLKVKMIRRPSWPKGKYIELTADPHGNLAAWGMLIEAGEPKRRIDVVGCDDADYEEYRA